MGWLVPSLFLLLWGWSFVAWVNTERDWWCYNNIEKSIFLLVVEGRVGGLGYARVAVGQDCIHLSTVSDENV